MVGRCRLEGEGGKCAKSALYDKIMRERGVLIWSLALSSFGGWPLGYPEMVIKGSKVLGVKRLECDTLFGCTSHNLELTEVVWALLLHNSTVY